ncbi:hypothetical protein UA08_01886 [Talaromyces atroroseus]|uniref:DUF7053 domain-containing protein n=1 Tax=Talaromyces atroroseus TaxID=1441469 RepID=A0A1Q5QB71_TALAT|nr:hypothetical protein UA08_01886 [Talaromyces atroroseus]OKL63185.1 hypothetical protein UA08_01886 [Talaromyces atroroseus]
MMKKKEAHTNITPLPSFIPRQLALDILHSHSEIITLNPLVLSHRAIPAPRDAPAEEYYSSWYEIVERIQVVPGTGRLGGSKISFRACFHDVPWGVQTHVYAPMGIDLRHNYRVAGTQPGEPAEYRELGINAPATGLYLREDIEIRCNFAMVGFVKNQLKSATKVLVDRLIKKAELLDAGVLKGMMENGKLKTINPADRSVEAQQQQNQQQEEQEQYPVSPIVSVSSPQLYQASTRGSIYHPDDYQQQTYLYPSPADNHIPGKSFATELPGDTSLVQSPTTANHNNARDSLQSTLSYPSTGGWSHVSSLSSASSTTNKPSFHNSSADNNTSRPMSTTSTIAPFVLVDNNYNNSHVNVKHQFAAELPAMAEMPEDKL